MTAKPTIAFYAPMKPPGHATPSGDRQIARLTLKALEMAGYEPFVASDLRTLDMEGSRSFQEGCRQAAEEECARLLDSGTRPDLWFTYHCYYKAPDLLGPKVSRRLGIPYVISEPSVSPKRRDGPWATHAAASEAAIQQADRLLVTTQRDRPEVEALIRGGADALSGAFPRDLQARIMSFPAFLDVGRVVAPRDAGDPLHLLSVAMMRPGDKVESYRRLAAALVHMPRDWTLTVIGGGSEEDVVQRLFAPHHARVKWLGPSDDPIAIRHAMERADLLVWPGVGEGVGMTYLEAQAAGLPVVAEDHPAQRDLIVSPLAPPDDPFSFADLVLQLAEDRRHLSSVARAHVQDCNSLEAAAARFRRVLDPLIARPG